MYPVIMKIGPFTLRSFGLMGAAAFLTGWAVLSKGTAEKGDGSDAGRFDGDGRRGWRYPWCQDLLPDRARTGGSRSAVGDDLLGMSLVWSKKMSLCPLKKVRNARGYPCKNRDE